MSLYWEIYQGETGAVRTGRLKDATGYIDLSGYDSVTVIAQKNLSSSPVINVAVTVDPDQVTNKGAFSFTFGSHANIDVNNGGYLLSFAGWNGLVPTYYPLSKDDARTYGRLIVRKPLG